MNTVITSACIIEVVNNSNNLDYWPISLTSLLSIFTLILMGYIAYKQIKIQKNQHNISHKQSEIQKHQHALALFKERWALFQEILEYMNNITESLITIERKNRNS